MSSFRWNGGGDFKGRKWDTDLPTDSSVSFLNPRAGIWGFGDKVWREQPKEVFEEHGKIRKWNFSVASLDFIAGSRKSILKQGLIFCLGMWLNIWDCPAMEQL